MMRTRALQTMPTFTCDVSQRPIPFEHVWEHTVGSDHAPMALRADWQAQLGQCRRELGFRHVRFHGLLSDDMGTLIYDKEELLYSFFNADQIIDFLLSIGMRPFVELSFMPTALASGSKTVFHYRGNVTPPRDYKKWSSLIHRLVGHWVERYGIREVAKWFFEVWNEPNLKAFWTGTQRDYFKLYRVTADAIKRVDPSLKVGGPATARDGWIEEFLEFNIVAAPTDDEARFLASSGRESFASLRRGLPIQLPPPSREFEKDVHPFGTIPLEQARSVAVVGSPSTVLDGVRRFISQTNADELMIVSHIYDHAARVRSLEIVAGVARALDRADCSEILDPRVPGC